jgi:hypothetical protein
MSMLNAHTILVYGPLWTGLAAGVALLLWAIFRRKRSPEEIERLRRYDLAQRGRIIDGSILDLTAPQGPDGPCVLQYQYEIAGVVYECGQDVTSLYRQARLDFRCIGMPASVRYDPKRPSNSIVVAETWSGLYLRERNAPPPSPTTPKEDPRL